MQKKHELSDFVSNLLSDQNKIVDTMGNVTVVIQEQNDFMGRPAGRYEVTLSPTGSIFGVKELLVCTRNTCYSTGESEETESQFIPLPKDYYQRLL